MADMEQATVTIEHSVCNGHSLKTDGKGVPVLTLTFVARGKEILKHIDMDDIAELNGKSVTLKVIDHQLRIKED